MIMRLQVLLIALPTALLIAGPAMACQPSRGTPEEIAAMIGAHQTDMWDKADLVFVARIEQRRTQSVADWKDAPQISLMPLTWLKGQAGPWQFDLGATSRTMCSLIPGFDALRGQVGDEFIVFVKGDTPTQETVIDAISLKALVEPRALAALKPAE